MTVIITLSAVSDAIIGAAIARMEELFSIENSSIRYTSAACTVAAALDSDISAKSIAEANAETLASRPDFAETGLMFTAAGTVILFGHLGRLMSLPGELPDGVTPRIVFGWMQTKGLSVTRIKSITNVETTKADAAREMKKAAGAAKAKVAQDKKDKAAKAAKTEASASVVDSDESDESAVNESPKSLLARALELVRQATAVDDEWTAESWELSDSILAEITTYADLVSDAEGDAAMAKIDAIIAA